MLDKGSQSHHSAVTGFMTMINRNFREFEVFARTAIARAASGVPGGRWSRRTRIPGRQPHRPKALSNRALAIRVSRAPENRPHPRRAPSRTRRGSRTIRARPKNPCPANAGKCAAGPGRRDSQGADPCARPLASCEFLEFAFDLSSPHWFCFLFALTRIFSFARKSGIFLWIQSGNYEVWAPKGSRNGCSAGA